MEYQDRYLAFLDLIGFKELVIKSVTDLESADLIAEVLSIFDETCLHVREQSPQLEMTHFSDSLVISIPSTPNEPHPLGDLLWFINLIAHQILSKGFLLRGGISLGPLFHEGQTVFGKALVDAYVLESEIAEYPRIIFSKSVRRVLDGLDQRGKEKVLFDTNDGPAYVHVLSNEELIGKRRSGNSKSAERVEPNDAGRIANLMEIKEQIVRRLEDSRDTPRHFKKNLWFVRYLNEKVIQAGLDGPTGWPDLIRLDNDRVS